MQKILIVANVVIVLSYALLASGVMPFGPCGGPGLLPLALLTLGIATAATYLIGAGALTIYRFVTRG
jgi:hypothetical protein